MYEFGVVFGSAVPVMIAALLVRVLWRRGPRWAVCLIAAGACSGVASFKMSPANALVTYFLGALIVFIAWSILSRWGAKKSGEEVLAANDKSIAAPSGRVVSAALEELEGLRQRGLVTDVEFQEKRTDILKRL